MTTHPKTVLVFRNGHLGDTLVSLPALRAIRNRHPQARLVLLTDTHLGRQAVQSWEVLGRTGLFSDVLFYDPQASASATLKALLKLAGQIRRLKPDVMYYLAPVPRTAQQVRRDRFFFHQVCGIGGSHGLVPSGTVLVQRDDHGRPVRTASEVLRLLNVVQENTAEVVFGVPIGEQEISTIDRLFEQSSLRSGASLIALGPGAGMPAKRWPVDRYASLASRLLATYPAAFLALVGGKEDAAAADLICKEAGLRALNWAGRLTVLESAEVLRRSVLFVGNDSGPMHLAASVGTRCVAVFSARDYPGMWEPFGSGHIVLRKHVPCSGCLLKVCEEQLLQCLTTISVEEVFQACIAALQNSGQQHAEPCWVTSTSGHSASAPVRATRS